MTRSPTWPTGNNMLALSAQPTAAKHNVENLGLEPVWPYNLIGDSGHQSDLAKRTFSHRSHITQNDWSFDALHPARLGLGNEMRTALIANINKCQVFPNGFASWDATKLTNPYLEELGVTAAAVTEGLVQDYDGTLRLAPGWPTGWDADGTVYIQHKGKAHVQIRRDDEPDRRHHHHPRTGRHAVPDPAGLDAHHVPAFRGGRRQPRHHGQAPRQPEHRTVTADAGVRLAEVRVARPPSPAPISTVRPRGRLLATTPSGRGRPAPEAGSSPTPVPGGRTRAPRRS
ncbi:hypothetical protein AB0K16_53370 [Nonomuraea jabiensis]|uniref:hypothetical protein n=1 Tax=Nonomuraea jabiensis TaxID=882448 RepID=UPI00343D4899